jgi:putative SOS response-associated peptidase YedK
MCGRFAQVIKFDQLQKLERELKLKEISEQLELSFNVAPTHSVGAAVRQQGQSYLGFFRWGLIPSWSREIPKFALINARAETIMEKPSFRSGLQRRRCLVPANGFYEWRQGDKQPFFIHAADGDLLYLAGIYDAWTDPQGSYVPSLAVITTAANARMAGIHQRMPVLLFGPDRLQWLEADPSPQNLVSLLSPCEDGLIDLYPVSPYVNKVGNNDARCLERVG